MSDADARRQAQIDLFEAARNLDIAACEKALEEGADLNFNRHNGGAVMAWRGWRLKMGGIEWGLQEWDAPDDVKPVTGDTITMIAIKCGLESLVRWAIKRPEYNPNIINKEGRNAQDVARDTNRISFLSDPTITTDSQPEKSPAMLVSGQPLNVKIEHSFSPSPSVSKSQLPFRHVRAVSEGMPFGLMHMHAAISQKDKEIEELKEALKRSKAVQLKLEHDMGEMRTRITILESSLKSTKPTWMR